MPGPRTPLPFASACTPHAGGDSHATEGRSRPDGLLCAGRALAACLAAATCAFALLAHPSPAHADVRASDTVLDKTAEQQGIATSELPDIGAAHAIVMGADGIVFYGRDADSSIKIASITKVMTALVALEHGGLDEILTVGHDAATIGEASAGLSEGDTLTLEEALVGLLVASGNDAAVTIANGIGRNIDPNSPDPYAAFIGTMNAKAAELGCRDTLFENPHGLDYDAWAGELHSTARDVATIYAAAMENETFRTLVNTDRTSITVTSADGHTATLPLTAHNFIRGQQGNIGGKTGTTDDAGECFIGGFSREVPGTEGNSPVPSEIYVAVFDADGNAMRFADTLALANWYYGHIAQVPLANTQVTTGDTPILAEAPCSSWTDKTVDVTVGSVEGSAADGTADGATNGAVDSAATFPVFSLGGELEQDVKLEPLAGDVQRGQGAGKLIYRQGGKTVAEVPLETAEAQAAPDPFEWVMVQIDRAVRFLQGKPATAEAVVLNEAPDPLAYDAA